MVGVRSLLKKIRNYLADHHLDALIVGHADEYLNEYLTPDKERLRALTGFTGSAGVAVVSAHNCVLFTDSRYTEQAKKQTSFTVYEVPRDTTVLNWIRDHLHGTSIGFYAKAHSVAWIQHAQKELKDAQIHLKPLYQNVVDLYWTDRPASQKKAVVRYPQKYAGLSTVDKLKQVADHITAHQMDAALISLPESTSWLLNKRGFANPQCPVIMQRVLVFADATYQKVTPRSLTTLKGMKVMADYTSLTYDIYEKVSKIALVSDLPDPVAALKAIKNKVEIRNLKKACLFESTVICGFLAYVETHKKTVSELDCARELARLRAQNPLYVADSFNAIVAAGAHATLAHYLPTAETSIPLKGQMSVLVDTGGQYYNGTTDMTRTLYLDEPTPLFKKRYTQVLKGHIAMASFKMKEGDLPTQMDRSARAFLRQDGVDYGHATGHGIGMFLSVHEAPPTIHEKSKTPLYAGMVFSNEPAFYDVSNKFGIRLENMLLAVLDKKQDLTFENLLYIPFDGRLIDFDLLTVAEKKWLKTYHVRIVRDVFPHLSEKTRKILQPLIDFFL